MYWNKELLTTLPFYCTFPQGGNESLCGFEKDPHAHFNWTRHIEGTPVDGTGPPPGSGAGMRELNTSLPLLNNALSKLSTLYYIQGRLCVPSPTDRSQGHKRD